MFESFGWIKDAALQKGLLMALRPKVEPYGDLRELSVDTSAKKISGEVLLRGEVEPLRVLEAFYKIEPQGDTATAVFYGIKVSKPWLQSLLNDHFPEIRVKLPDFARKILM